MKTFFLAVIFLSLVTEKAFSQAWTWSVATAPTNGERKMHLDAAGDLYFYNCYNAQAPDTIKKITTVGNLLLAIPLPQNLYLSCLTTTQDTGFCAAGTFHTPFIIGGNTYNGYGSNDIWIGKFDRNGNIEWLKIFGSKELDLPHDLCTTPVGYAITGRMGDSANFNGVIVPKQKNKDLFIATFDQNGAFLNCKFSTGTNTFVPSMGQTVNSISFGSECKSDVFGNIYLIANSYGKSTLDNYNLGSWNTIHFEQPFTTTLIKLNSSLQAQYCHTPNTCEHFCYPYDNLTVSSIGEVFVVNHTYYGQSGNDDHDAKIIKISSSGSQVGTFKFRSEIKTEISDIELDNCGDLYFTGYLRTKAYSSPFFASAIVAKLSPNLILKWFLNDSTQASAPEGFSLALLDSNKIFINGIIQDTIIENQYVFASGNKIGFFAKVTPPVGTACVSSSVIGNEAKRFQLKIFPNPSNDIFYLPEELNGADLKIYSGQGKLVHHEKQCMTSFSLKEQPIGIYLLKADTPNGNILTSRLILTK